MKYRLTIQAEPVRFACLVRNRADLRKAVDFLSHTWAGASSYIFPTPRNKYEESLLSFAIRRAAPDFILTPQKCGKKLRDALKPLTAPIIAALDDEILSQYSNGDESIAYYSRKFPKMTDLINEGRLNASSRIVASKRNATPLLSAIRTGYASDRYAASLSKRTPIGYIPKISSDEDHIDTAFLCATSQTVRSLTLRGIESSLSFDDAIGDGFESFDFLWIYLAPAGDHITLTTYWNQSAYWTANKILLDKAVAVNKPALLAERIKLFAPGISNVRIITIASEDEAELIERAFSENLQNFLGKSINVSVTFDGWPYGILHANQKIGHEQFTSAEADEHNLIEYSATTPKLLRDSCIAFTHRIECRDSRGQILSVPDDHESMRILSYGPNRINTFGGDLNSLQKLALWPVSRCIKTSIRIVSSERRCDDRDANNGFFRPNDSVFLKSYFQQKGFDLRANDAAHYASMYLRKLGPITKQRPIDNELDAARSLFGKHYETTPQPFNRLVDSIKKMRNIETNEARAIIERALPTFLQASLVQRGFKFPCGECGFGNWHSLESVSEGATCPGCGSWTLIPTNAAILYRPTDTLRQFFKSGARAVINTLWQFSNMMRPGILQVGGELWRSGENRAFCDIDVIRLSNEELAVIECKDWSQLSEKQRYNLGEAAQKLIESAVAVKATSAYVSIYSDSDTNTILAAIATARKAAHAADIELRAIINDRLYEWGAEGEDLTPKEWRFNSTQVIQLSPWRPKIIGKLPRSYGGGSFGDHFNPSAIQDTAMRIGVKYKLSNSP